MGSPTTLPLRHSAALLLLGGALLGPVCGQTTYSTPASTSATAATAAVTGPSNSVYTSEDTMVLVDPYDNSTLLRSIRNLTFVEDTTVGALNCGTLGKPVTCKKTDILFTLAQPGVPLAGFMFEVIGTPIYQPPTDNYILGTVPGNPYSHSVFSKLRVTVERNPESLDVHSHLVSGWSFRGAYVDATNQSTWHLATLYTLHPGALRVVWACAHSCPVTNATNVERCWAGDSVCTEALTEQQPANGTR
jgi:hypothetical protein